MSALEPRKTIVINPDFLKFPMRGGRTKKNRENANNPPKPIKIRTENKSGMDKTYKRRALNYIRKHQEEKYKRMMNGDDPASPTKLHDSISTSVRSEVGDIPCSGIHQSNGIIETTGGKSYADNFNNQFDDSLAFLQKLTDQNSQKIQSHNSTLKQYPQQLPHIPNSILFENRVLDQILDQNISVNTPSVFNSSFSLPKPTYGCLKGGTLPTFRTLKSRDSESTQSHLAQPQSQQSQQSMLSSSSVANTDFGRETTSVGGKNNIPRMTPEQQRAELKQFLEQRKEEKNRIERVKRQRGILKPSKKQKRTTTRTFRVGKSKHYPRIGVLIPNKTIRTQVLAKKQKIRETPLEDVRRYLIKKGLIRVGSSCPNDVLRQMHESSMMMCGEIQNHNPDNLLYNYLHNGL